MLRFRALPCLPHQHSYTFRSLIQIQWPVERFPDTRKTMNNSIWTPMANSRNSKPASTTCSARLPSWAALLVTMLACARTSTSATVSATAPTLFAPPQLMSPLQLPMAAASVLLLLVVLEPVEVSAITLQAQRQKLTVSLPDGVSTTTDTTLTTVATGTTTTTATTGTSTGGVRDSLEQRLEHC